MLRLFSTFKRHNQVVLLDSVGFRREGLLRQEVYREEGLIDQCYVGILSNDLNQELLNECQVCAKIQF